MDMNFIRVVNGRKEKIIFIKKKNNYVKFENSIFENKNIDFKI